jgi:hypothetical protein
MARKLAEFGADIGRSFVRVARMPANGGVNLFVLFSECQRAPAAGEVAMEIILVMPAASARASTSTKSDLYSS